MKFSRITAGVVALATTTSTSAFTTNGPVGTTTKSALSATTTEESALSRRGFGVNSILTLATTLLPLTALSAPAAAVSGEKKVNAKLKGYGLPALENIPDNFVPLLSIYGKGKNRSPLLVTFAHPLNWVVTLPSNLVNGEDGTIQAGDYGKGDTATLYVDDALGSIDVSKASKETIDGLLKKSIGQRGENMYQNFKITKIEPGPGPYYSGQSYVLVDFKYEVLTGAGFEVDRKGVASITSVGKSVQVLWAASISARFKKTGANLREIVKSFRCYADGLNFSDELAVFADAAATEL